MPVDPSAAIEISAFNWVPPFARGMVRDFRVRWALEELDLPYRVRLLSPMGEKPQDYLLEQPFGQVPIFVEGDLHLFETGAILLHLGERSEVLLPRDAAGKARATCWLIAALNSVEPMMFELVNIDIFNKGTAWAAERRPEAERMVRSRLQRLSDWLGQKEHLEGRFTVADLMMTTVLRNLRHTSIVADYPNLADYQARCEARPAFGRAMAAQLADFADAPVPAAAE